MTMTLQTEMQRCLNQDDLASLDSLKTFQKIRMAIIRTVGGDLTEEMMEEYDAYHGIMEREPTSKGEWINSVIPQCERQRPPTASRSTGQDAEIVHRIPVRVFDDKTRSFTRETLNVVAHKIDDKDAELVSWKRYTDYGEPQPGTDVRHFIERLSPEQRSALDSAFDFQDVSERQSSLPCGGLLEFLLTKLDSELRDLRPNPQIWPRARGSDMDFRDVGRWASSPSCWRMPRNS